jgi:phospholipid/cholesterol/gamma-HCH transport system permease protein
MLSLLARLGRATREILALAGNLFNLELALAGRLLRPDRLNFRLLTRISSAQTRFTGVQAAPLVSLTAAIVGAVGIMQFVDLLTGLADDLIGKVLVTIIVREMGPLVTAVIIICRSGTAITTELGFMRLDGEFDALKAFRIDPVEFVILPRMLGMSASMFGLMVLFDLVGLLGGAGIAHALRGLSYALIQGRLSSALTLMDFVFSLAKALAFGQAVSVISCYFGLRVLKSPTELPQAVTKAVVTSLIAVFLLEAVFSAVWYLLL